MQGASSIELRELCEVLIQAARVADVWVSSVPGPAILWRRRHRGNSIHGNWEYSTF